MSAMPPLVPDTIEELLDPAWLTAALGLRFPGVEVVSVDEVVELTRVATNVLFRIHCAGDVPAGLPERLCGKGYFGDGKRARRVSESETRFYMDLAPDLPIRTLRIAYTDFDPATTHGVVISEDATARGGMFLDALSPYSPDQVAASLEQLAALHSHTWAKASLADVPWLASRLEHYRQPTSLGYLRANFEGPIGDRIPIGVRDVDRLSAAQLALANEVGAASPWCVIHGDAHVGNVLLDTVGAPSFLDWQLVQRGPWYVDVGYHIASALTVADRRANELDLVQHYLDRLAAGGVDPPARDDAWAAVRRGVVHGFFLWGTTQKVKPEITTVVLERLGSAVDDHESLSRVLGSTLRRNVE